MASSVSNVRTVDVGGGLTFVIGNYTTTVGSAALSFTCAGMPLMWQILPASTVTTGATVEPQDPFLSNTVAGVSVSGAITTLTIYGNANVTNGTFCLLVSKGG